MLSDIEIAQNAKMKHIRDVAASIGIAEDDLEFYGNSCYGNKSYSGRRR